MNYIRRIEPKLTLFALYFFFLIYELIRWRNGWLVLWIHIAVVLIFSLFYFGRDFLYVFVAPIIAVMTPIEHLRLKRYLKGFKQNIPAEAVLVFGHSNWYKLEAWIKPNFTKHETKSIIGYLQKKEQDFACYLKANFEDVKRIMSDPNIKEVYFCGHGNSHSFQLNTDYILYYCEFDDSKYTKEFVHQVHCGTWHGKSLIDYVVPEKNKNACFLFRKPIHSGHIRREFKKRTRNLIENRAEKT